MCQKLPGPRCSPHALQKLSITKQLLQNTPPDSPQRQDRINNVEKAQRDYDSTPEGIESLKEKYRSFKKEGNTVELEK